MQQPKKACPYCGGQMEMGVIYQDRYPVKWIPAAKDRGSFLAPFTKGIRLTSFLEGRDSVAAAYCSRCGKMIIELEK